MISYILQTLLYQAIFLIVYDFFHKKDTFFVINRMYLLGSSIFSLLLPFLKFNSIQQTIPDQYIVDLPTVFIGNNNPETFATEVMSTPLQPVSLFDSNTIWIIVYTAGALIMLSIFIKRITSIYKLKSASTLFTEFSIKYYRIPNSSDAFSFWNLIFIGDNFSRSERRHILTHELVHLKERHSLDLLWFEFLKIVFWFNPLVYVYHSRATLLHEYISDAKVIQKLGKKAYFEQLLNTNFQTKNIRFTNNFFNHHFLKKRFIMLQKSKSKSNNKLKYSIIFPIISIMVLLFSFTKNNVPNSETKEYPVQEASIKLIDNNQVSNSKQNTYANKETSTKSIINSSKKPGTAIRKHKISTDSVNDHVPFAVVEKLPLTQKCKSIATYDETKKCVSNEIREFVKDNFNFDALRPYTNPGINRIYVRFKINKQGKIVDVQSRGPAPELEKEATRVIRSIPQMIPGEHQGKKVNVLYSLPIVFEQESTTANTSTSNSNPVDVAILTEKLDDNSIEKGYYLISNIYKSEPDLKKGLAQLKSNNLHPQVFQNPKDNYYYMYLERFDNPADAKKNLISNYGGKYPGDMYILQIQ